MKLRAIAVFSLSTQQLAYQRDAEPGVVIAPQFGDEEADDKAFDLLSELYPDRKVVQLDIDAISAGGGGIHCVTSHQPMV